MKKTLAVAAVMAAFAGSAMADVTVYGRMDTGVLFADEQVEVNGQKVFDDTSFAMQSGNFTTSRVGIKGSEQLTDTTKVGFVLETKVLGDTGSAFASGFDRESVVYIDGAYGKLFAGYVNSMWSDGGSTNFWAGNYSAFGTGSSVGVGTGLMVGQSRAANRLAYVSPKFGGFHFQAEYAFGTDGSENESASDRAAALGVNYKAGAFGAGMVVTYKNEKSWIAAKATTGAVPAHVEEQEDEMTVNVGAAFDFGMMKVMGAVQYFTGADNVGGFSGDADTNLLAKNGYEDLEGYAVTLSATAPVCGGTLMFGGSYTDGEDKAEGATGEFNGYNVAVQYVYPFSKQTSVYAGVGYTALEAEDAQDKGEYKATKAMAGLVHHF